MEEEEQVPPSEESDGEDANKADFPFYGGTERTGGGTLPAAKFQHH